MNREQGLKSWLLQQLPAGAVSDVQALSGDASFRRYFRVYREGAESLIAVDAPPDTEKNREFTCVAQHLFAHGVKVPEVFAFDYQQGYLLLSDLGDQVLLPLLADQSVDRHYHDAVELLIQMQLATNEGLQIANYSESLLYDEMALFTEWFVTRLLDYSLSSDEKMLIDTVFQQLIASAKEQPQVFVHRDYHSRNIMQTAAGDLATIDFQDAVTGPVTYDLVSLFRDCYVQWPSERVEQWVQAYQAEAQKRGVLDSVEEVVFMRWFDLMGLQRHIKVLGIFARLYLRDGKKSYLNDLPLVINYTLSVADKYPELSSFCCWFRKSLMPLIHEQSWWQAGEKGVVQL